jgi:2'-5' RNA ligase
MPKKNPNQISLFPEAVYEYFVLLSPSDAIKADVDAMKEQLHEMIGLDTANRNSIAHISLYKQEGMDQAVVKSAVKKALAGQKRFMVKITGYGIYENKASKIKTLYLKIEDPTPIDNLFNLLCPPKRPAKKIERQISILDKPGKTLPKAKTINPHITIARNIDAADFDRIEDFTPFEYENEFECTSVTLLRRLSGSDKHFSPVAEIKLG